MKRILDTVHGYILIRDEFVKFIVDTQPFQRLRRIEQTSIRSIFPSARHDRFIHSLGVFHIGSLIVNHLIEESKENKYWKETETTLMVLFDSYLVACLLHDIGHAPFSHSFEEYYGQKSDLSNRLSKLVQNSQFTFDLTEAKKDDEPNFHEYMSAIVVYSYYYNIISNRLYLDPELVIRMITGILYKEEEQTHQIHNCLISLLHGKVIDADRLDYACRDVWASGYCTSTIDLRRLVSALHIKYSEDNGIYVVCFESNSINEIEGVLNVKDFQVKYVLNHHTVCYEQWLLKKAAEQMAIQFYPREDNNGAISLKNILNEKTILDCINIQILPQVSSSEKNNSPEKDKNSLIITNISDDDLIFLIKQSTYNDYYFHWSNRDYSHSALWKSRDEFYHYFGLVNNGKSLKHKDFESTVKSIISNKLNCKEDDVIICAPEYKPRVNLDNLYLVVADEVVKYTDIHTDKRDLNEKQVFYYVYIPKKQSTEKHNWKELRKELINSLKEPLLNLYSDKGVIDAPPVSV